MKWLNVSHNRLAWFDFAFVPPSVEWLDVVGNKIDALGNYYGLLVREKYVVNQPFYHKYN